MTLTQRRYRPQPANECTGPPPRPLAGVQRRLLIEGRNPRSERECVRGIFFATGAGRRSDRDHVSGATAIGEVLSEELAQQVDCCNALGRASGGSIACPRATVAQDGQILAGAGLAEVERLTEVADAELVVVVVTTGRLTRRSLLCRRSNQWVGVNLGAAVRRQSARR